MAGSGKGRAWKPKTEAQKFSQRASEELGKKLGSAFKMDGPPALYPEYRFSKFEFQEDDDALIDALRGHVQRLEGSPYFVAHRDTRTASRASAEAFTARMATVEAQVRGTPMVTKELVGTADGRAAKRARTFSVSSMLAEEAGGPTGRTRQRSFDHGVDALARKEARRAGAGGEEEVPEEAAAAVDEGEGVDDLAADYTVDHYAESDGEDGEGGEATMY